MGATMEGIRDARWKMIEKTKGKKKRQHDKKILSWIQLSKPYFKSKNGSSVQ